MTGSTNTSLYTGQINYQSVPSDSVSCWTLTVTNLSVNSDSITLPSGKSSYADDLEHNNIDNRHPNQKGLIRLMQILIRETAYLIWAKLYRVTGETPKRSRSFQKMAPRDQHSNRLTEDKLIATKRKRKLTRHRVKETWEKLLQLVTPLRGFRGYKVPGPCRPLTLHFPLTTGPRSDFDALDEADGK